MSGLLGGPHSTVPARLQNLGKTENNWPKPPNLYVTL